MHQYLFHIGDFPIRMYGLMLTLAIFLATGTAYFLARQDGRWHEHVLDIGIYGGFAGLIGGRLWDVFFFDWSYYQDHLLEIPFVWQGGMAVQGGMLGGLVTGIIYCKLHKIDWLALAEELARTLEAREQLLKLMSMNHYDMEANSRMERLVEFKYVYGASLKAVERLLEKFCPDLAEQERKAFLYAFFPFIYGIYPYAVVTDKQRAAMDRAKVGYVYHSIFDLAYACAKKLLEEGQA